MANLIGYIDSDKNKIHSTSSNFMSARLETWEGAIEVVMHKSGKFEVFVGPKDGHGTKLAEGNVNEKGEIVYYVRLKGVEDEI